MNKMEDPNYWLERMIQARVTNNDHQAVFHTDLATWNNIQKTQTTVLTNLIRKGSTVVDVGCGAGYLMECMPYGVTYVGVDLNPYFIAWAQRRYEKEEWAKFYVVDAKDMSQYADNQFDWSVSRSVIGCCGIHAGYETANKMHSEIIRIGKQTVFLGYDPADQFTLGNNPDHVLTLGAI